MFSFTRTCQVVFQSGCKILHSHQECMRRPISLSPSQHLVLSLFCILAILISLFLPPSFLSFPFSLPVSFFPLYSENCPSLTAYRPTVRAFSGACPCFLRGYLCSCPLYLARERAWKGRQGAHIVGRGADHSSCYGSPSSVPMVLSYCQAWFSKYPSRRFSICFF